MYPDEIGIANFGVVVIQCFKVNDDDGKFSHYSFKYQGEENTYTQICKTLKQNYPDIASLLEALGREKFLKSVLEWDPSKESTRTAFYSYLADQINKQNSWDKDDQVRWN